MASALCDENRLPLSRRAEGVRGSFVRVTVAPWTPPVIVESVIEIAVLVATMPSAFVDARVLRETIRAKLDDP